mmetsp:Transcript_11781/g.24853  ORF Transcript_11781/g.24853 Transcript_11781/m.24853 type:complete len:231 (-) Transcript_11781:15-707(-)
MYLMTHLATIQPKPAPICTAGPSRPMARPEKHASVSAKILTRTTLNSSSLLPNSRALRSSISSASAIYTINCGSPLASAGGAMKTTMHAESAAAIKPMLPMKNAASATPFPVWLLATISSAIDSFQSVIDARVNVGRYWQMPTNRPTSFQGSRFGTGGRHECGVGGCGGGSGGEGDGDGDGSDGKRGVCLLVAGHFAGMYTPRQFRTMYKNHVLCLSSMAIVADEKQILS